MNLSERPRLKKIGNLLIGPHPSNENPKSTTSLNFSDRCTLPCKCMRKPREEPEYGQYSGGLNGPPDGS